MDHTGRDAGRAGYVVAPHRGEPAGDAPAGGAVGRDLATGALQVGGALPDVIEQGRRAPHGSDRRPSPTRCQPVSSFTKLGSLASGGKRSASAWLPWFVRHCMRKCCVFDRLSALAPWLFIRRPLWLEEAQGLTSSQSWSKSPLDGRRGSKLVEFRPTFACIGLICEFGRSRFIQVGRSPRVQGF